MHTEPLTEQRLADSVWAVPPLARHDDLSVNAPANQQIISHLEAGGISTILYGGNAVFYHVALSEYGEILEQVAAAASAETLIIPAVGPAYGTMMDQAKILRDYEFPTAMVLPQQEVASPEGIAVAIERFAERFGKPVVLYIKHDRAVAPEAVGRLMERGVLSAVKYAVRRDDPGNDVYLQELVEAAGTTRMLSGLGDQPAPIHMRQFGLATFTTGCGCVAPRLCMALHAAIHANDSDRIDAILRKFAPLEDLRNRYGVITVLHETFRLAGIADTGPVLPLLTPVDPAQQEAIRIAAENLLAADAATDDPTVSI